jgi:ABC-type sugar transport system ATPase subunit
LHHSESGDTIYPESISIKIKNYGFFHAAVIGKQTNCPAPSSPCDRKGTEIPKDGAEKRRMARIRLIDVSRYFAVSSENAVKSRSRASAGEKSEARSELNVPVGGIAALDHVNLEIPDGVTYAVVGPSGCGKTTLLRVVSGLDQEYTGRVMYDEIPMNRVRPQDRRIGMVFQNYALYPHWKGEGNLRFFFQVHSVKEAETRERIRVTSKTMGVGFKDLLGRMPRTLSEGQKQRVAIARAIVREPRLMLLDEPMSNLDAQLRERSRIEIRHLLAHFHITTLYVTHDQHEAAFFGDRIVVMREGRIEQVGEYLDMVERPTNIFVAGFLGRHPMNLFPGGIVERGMLHLPGHEIPLSENVRALVADGRKLTAGVRAEAARIGSAAHSDGDFIRVRGTVELIEPDFSRKENAIQVHSERAVFFADCPLDLPLALKEEVEMAFPADAFVFFDEESGKRIG